MPATDPFVHYLYGTGNGGYGGNGSTGRNGETEFFV
jgi:hypothetical protein